MYFDELNLGDDLLDALDAMHFDTCTPIQEMAIPPALEGHDIMAIAQTGTGKTAAYLLPVLERLTYGNYPTDAINCIIMTPTRELAMQIDRQMEGFAYYLPVSSLPIYGGTDGREFSRQQTGLKKGADIVIATPGRLLAHLQMGYCDLSKISFFILDEADRMLDMGFFDDIMAIAKHLPKERQTLMFSATMPGKIKQLAAGLLKNPVEVKTAISRPADAIEQSAAIVYEPQKEYMLRHILKTKADKRVIIFAASKQKVKDLNRQLRKVGIKSAEMHSDLEQDSREEALLAFRSGRIDVLVATDIVARGIDIDDIVMVVNYDVPREAEDYVHRIGRTARAGAGGKAVTLVNPDDQRRFGGIERFLKYEIAKETIPVELGETPVYQPFKHRNSRKKAADNQSGSKSDKGKKKYFRHSRRHKKPTHGGKAPGAE
ncbi:MAG: DEAD/DEAH box helicase [Prevotella sp.]|nr:DEAD/DEAH box helicase [Prevotella sp.]MCM1075248.1 DEAD/DEAH box helicase [Ruminococcus sp.]